MPTTTTTTTTTTTITTTITTSITSTSITREFLESVPDVVFVQDSIEQEDLAKVLETVSQGRYHASYQVRLLLLPPPPPL